MLVSFQAHLIAIVADIEIFTDATVIPYIFDRLSLADIALVA